jgi:hypothetical protein
VHDSNSCFKAKVAEGAGEHETQRHIFSAANPTIVASGGMKQVKGKAENH